MSPTLAWFYFLVGEFEMKRFALSMVAATAAALSSSAAFAEPVFNWSGYYMGANGGAAWSADRTVFVDKRFMEMPIFEGTFGSRHVSGGFGGGQIGYNSQWGNWVFGLEADFQGGSIHGGSSDETRISIFGRTGSIRFDTSECMGFFSTVRGRVGYSWDRLLIYGTGGGAFGEMNTRIGMLSSFGAEAAATNREWRGGYTVGGGLEYAFSYSWSAKFEYQYIDFGSSTTSAPEIFRGIPWNTFISTNTRHDFNTFRVGLNYRWGEPMVALAR
jgi:outer membrane immunogenic protein